MPALPSTVLFDALASRSELLTANGPSTALSSGNATNGDDAMQVVCAWPLSGQYGIGSRALYYALVAACIFARKAEWLRNACLAAALIFPAVAALHGIVLAVLHTDSAVDMDVYGAFQFCAIGLVAAPLTVRMSRTYFYDPGRNIIFLWTGVVLAGLLSLTVEFFRITTSACPHDDSGNPVSPLDFKGFPYEQATCGLTCSIEQGPKSPLRQGATNEIYVIPAPNILTFNAATLLAAACCIPAILSLASMWNKILEINWKSRFGQRDGNKLIEGTNGATVAKMSKVNTVVRLFLSTVEIPLFSGAVIALLIFGEWNFASPQMAYQTELMTSIGQWAPLVGTGLAALGSLYLLVVDLEMTREGATQTEPVCCACSNHNFSGDQCSGLLISAQAACSVSSEEGRNAFENAFDSPPLDPRNPSALNGVYGGALSGSCDSIVPPDAVHLPPSLSSHGGVPAETDSFTSQPKPKDPGNRRKVAKVLRKVSDYFGTAKLHQFDDSEFKHGKAVDFPEVPGEEQRNPDLPQIREQYNTHREDESSARSIIKRSPRSDSFTGSVSSRFSAESGLLMTRAISAESLPPPHSRSSSSAPSTAGITRSDTLPPVHGPAEQHDPTRGQPRQRRDTLEVPVLDFHSSSRASSSSSPLTTVTAIANGQGSPAIVIISPDAETDADADAEPLTLNPATASLSSASPSSPPADTLPQP
ncbi:hypothetical protein GGS23DRAFT_578756 [Durotheca rogersii]|uniref:uncharacterized protein n=1 Tax=Durotheca rogersii TaxID=419775 RepID=UPI002220C4DB|nr:uncharacterized protein GGS23DRAFT_578756 [Durotheca rogersii]KAI5861096.1 hypothetical protein GGS23DRAFT_578756 [Durotheca rogersii]